MLDWISDALVGFWDFLLGALEAASSAVLEAVWSAVVAVVSACGIDAPGALDLAPFSVPLSVVNQWVPLDTAVAMASCYWALLASLVTVRFVLKLIPGIW